MTQAGSQEIKCSVETCKYNDKSRFCTLHDIVVGSENSDAKAKTDTQCKSFETDIQ